MIKYVLSDLFDEPADYIMEQKNCFGIHGGLAREMARRYPKAAQADLATELGEITKLGTYEIVDCGDIKVINAYGQFFIGGEATDYEAWTDILDKLNKEIVGGSIKIPFKIGCGMGGGSWPIMEQLFVNYFGEGHPTTIKICIRKEDKDEGLYFKEIYEDGCIRL